MRRLFGLLSALLIVALLVDGGQAEARPLAQGQTTQQETAVYGLLGTLQPARRNRYETQLRTTTGAVYPVVGVDAAMERRLQRLRMQPQLLVKVWGLLVDDLDQDDQRRIVVRDLLVMETEIETIAQEPVQATVSADVANVRARPSTDAEVLARVRAGRTLHIIGRDTDDRWWRVCCIQGQIGWIAQRMVDAPPNITFIPALQGGVAAPTPTVAPTATPLPSPALPDDALPTQDWFAAFYDNISLEGDPVLVTSVDAVVFDWDDGSPAPEVPADGFSARFERLLTLTDGFYRFVVQADDGVRVWVGDDLVVDEWHMAEPAEYRFGRTIEEPTPVRIEYYEDDGQAAIRFDFELISEFPDWQASYFDNIDLAGGPDWIQAEPRTDPALDHSWSLDSPVPDVIPEDNFSARWEGTFFFEGGDYLFWARADDGVRLYIDDILVLDAWEEGGYAEELFSGVGPGDHTVTIEYYERGGIASIQADWRRVAP